MKIKKEIKDKILELPNLSAAYLFGSRAKGSFKEDSDYDICIVINDDNKQLVFKKITDFLLKNKEFIQPLVLTEKEFNDKMKIQVYRKAILENGILIKSET